VEPGTFYHIYNRGNNRERIFRSDENYRYFLRKYKSYLAPFADTYAYCLQPTHFHFCLRVKDDISTERIGNLTPLEKAFRDFFISYAKSINKQYGRTGSLFQYKFKRKPADDLAYRMRLVVYIHANPVRAGLCSQLAGWTFSSYPAFFSQAETAVQRDAVLEWFDGLEDFVSFHEEYLDWEPSSKW
jgi:REP element-mobilizing transposase RayT